MSQRLQKIMLIQPDESQAEIFFVHRQLHLVGDRGHPGIQCTQKLVGTPFHFEGNDRAVGNDNGPYIEIVRCDRGYNEIFGRWEHYRAITTQGVAGGTRRCSNDKAIGPIGVQEIAVDERVDLDHRGGVLSMNSEFVQGERIITKKIGIRI